VLRKVQLLPQCVSTKELESSCSARLSVGVPCSELEQEKARVRSVQTGTAITNESWQWAKWAKWAQGETCILKTTKHEEQKRKQGSVNVYLQTIASVCARPRRQESPRT